MTGGHHGSDQEKFRRGQGTAKVEVEENRDGDEVMSGAGLKKCHAGTVNLLSLFRGYPQEEANESCQSCLSFHNC